MMAVQTVPPRAQPAAPAPQAEDVPPATAAAPRILLVEDEYIVAVELEHILTEAGFNVVGTAADAEVAVRLALAERPALVVMDIRLPGSRDGVDAALDIYNASGIRSVFATAYAEPAIRRRAETALPLGWVSKPYRSEALVAVVRDALRRLQG